jgi:hypothetical protein
MIPERHPTDEKTEALSGPEDGQVCQTPEFQAFCKAKHEEIYNNFESYPWPSEARAAYVKWRTQDAQAEFRHSEKIRLQREAEDAPAEFRHSEKIRLQREADLQAAIERENIYFAICQGWFYPTPTRSEKEIIEEGKGNSTPQTIAQESRENKKQ